MKNYSEGLKTVRYEEALQGVLGLRREGGGTQVPLLRLCYSQNASVPLNSYVKSSCPRGWYLMGPLGGAWVIRAEPP